jgi:hypothetical protein
MPRSNGAIDRFEPAFLSSERKSIGDRDILVPFEMGINVFDQTVIADDDECGYFPTQSNARFSAIATKNGSEPMPCFRGR